MYVNIIYTLKHPIKKIQDGRILKCSSYPVIKCHIYKTTSETVHVTNYFLVDISCPGFEIPTRPLAKASRNSHRLVGIIFS